MAMQAAARSNPVAEFAARLLAEREVIPRAQILAAQIAQSFPDSAAVVYLIEQTNGKAEWRQKAAKGAISLPKSLLPHDRGTLAGAWQKRDIVVFSGETTHREEYSHLDVRRTVTSLGYLPLSFDGAFLGTVEVITFAAPLVKTDLEVAVPFIEVASISLSAAAEYEAERNGQMESLNRMTQLYDLERSFNSTLRMEQLLPIITMKIREDLEVQAVNIWMLEEDALVLMNRNGEDPTTEVGEFQRTGEGVAAEVSDSGKGVVINSEADERLSKRNQGRSGALPRALVAVPIIYQNYEVGVLEVINKLNGRHFTEDDVFFINTVTQTVGSALHNASLLEAERKIEILETLVEVSREITSSLNMDRIIQLVVNGPQKIMAYDRAAVAVEHHGKTQLKAISGKTEVNMAEPNVKRLRDVMEWALHSEHEVYVVQHREVIDAEREETRLKFKEYFEQTGARGFYAVPLADEQGRMGVLAFESRNPDFLSDTHFEMIRVLASQASVALRNASLYKEVPFIGVLEPLLQKKHAFMAMDKRRRGAYAVLAAAAALFLALCPLPMRVVGDAVVTPQTTSKIQTPVDAVVRNVYVKEGDSVKAGTVLADLEDWNQRSALAAAQAKFDTVKADMNRALAAKDGGEAGIQKSQVDYWASEVERAKERLERTRLRASVDGIVSTPHMEEAVGQKFLAGDTIATVVNTATAQVDVSIDADDLPLLSNGDGVAIKLESFPTRKFSGKVGIISPVSLAEIDKRVFQARVEVANEAGLLRPGMQGRGKISTGYRPAGFVLLRTPAMWLWTKVWTWFGW
jgi:RND family efflux transporter MFP subunit